MDIKKIAAAALCLALAGCSPQNDDGAVTQSMTVSLTDNPVTAAPEEKEEKKGILGDYTEASPEITEPESSTEFFSVYDIWEKNENEHVSYWCYALDESRVCFAYTLTEYNDDLGGYTADMAYRLADIETGEALGQWLLADDNNIYVQKFCTDVKDALFKVVFGKYPVKDDGEPDYTADLIYYSLVVRDDHSQTEPEVHSQDDYSAFLFTSAGEHQIAEMYRDIRDEDGNIIVAGSIDPGIELDLAQKRQYYVFPLDEERFVYRTAGYESLPGFGVYDYTSAAAYDVPESRDLIPIGVRNGKIISYRGAWDGMGGRELYITDPDTLETQRADFDPPELGLNQYYDFFMPESGSYIAMIKAGDLYNDDPITIYTLDPDTFEITGEYPLDNSHAPKYYDPYVLYANDDVIAFWQRDLAEIFRIRL